MVGVALLFPPSVDPRGPHLALPSLAAALRARGVEVSMFDLNLQALLWATSESTLTDARHRCRAQLEDRGLSDTRRLALRQALARSSWTVSSSADAVASLRDADIFFDPDRHHHARATVRWALELISLASERVTYGLSPASYRVDGVDAAKLGDLERVTADPDANLFHDLWTRGILADLEERQPSLVGVSILNSMQIIPGLTLARSIKERGHRVLIGGTVYAKFADRLLRRPRFIELFCDGVVPYEGETAFLEALDVVDSGSMVGVPNTIALDAEGHPQMGPVHIEDVAGLPTPDFDGLPLDDYLAPAPVLPVLTGKGCYFNRCKFCDIPHINDVSPRAYRVRKPETVADDVWRLHQSYGARHFVITDESLSPALLSRLADAVLARPELEVAAPRFVGYARLEPGFTPELCRRIHEAGFRKLFFGLESGSQATLDHMDKGINVADAPSVLRHCSEAGIAVHVFSIVGFPEESEDSADETFRFFVDNVDVLGAAQHSFDIHRFGLDLRTDYFDAAADLGVTVDFDVLDAQDFPISVRAWTNSRGVGEDDVDRLISKYDEALRPLYQGTHIYPEQHWPGFEEYAVLYGDHFEDRFSFRTALPSPGSPEVFALEWAPSTKVGDVADGRVLVWAVGGEATVGAPLVEALSDMPRPGTADSVLAELASRFVYEPEMRADLLAELRMGIDVLLGARVLWYRPQDGPTVSQPAGGSAATAVGHPDRSRFRREAQPRALGPQVDVSVLYDDATTAGGPLSKRADHVARQAFSEIVEMSARCDPREVASVERRLATAAGRSELAGLATVNGHEWQLRPEVLFPDPSLTRPHGLQLVQRGREAMTIDVEPHEWPALRTALASWTHGSPVEDKAMKALSEELEERGYLIAGDVGTTTAPLAFIGHNTVVVRSATSSVVVDPFFLGWSDDEYAPLGPRQIGPVDIALVTHSHPDHFDPGSLLRLDLSTRVVVPWVERESLLCVDMAYRLRQLGFEEVIELDWGDEVTLGDVTISAVPFRGEQPTSGRVLHEEVRNRGCCYVVESDQATVAFAADAGRDHSGSIRDEASRWVSRRGCVDTTTPVDILFAGYRGWYTYPSQLLRTSVARYALFVPPEQWGIRQQLMNDPHDAVDLAEAWGASRLVPYGAGGAPWYWERGLGPRLDGSGIVDDDFDPWPERVVEAAASRLSGRDGTRYPSPVDVRILRPGDELASARAGDVIRQPGHGWNLHEAR